MSRKYAQNGLEGLFNQGKKYLVQENDIKKIVQSLKTMPHSGKIVSCCLFMAKKTPSHPRAEKNCMHKKISHPPSKIE